MFKNGNTVRKGVIPNWEPLKADLKSLSGEQLRLVLELVQHLKKVNEEDKKVGNSNQD